MAAHRPFRFYILCGNAAFNRGDRANLCAQIELLRNRFSDADITVDSFRPEVDRGWYPVRVLRRSVFLSREQLPYLRRADLIIWGGGALIADNAGRWLVPWWCAILWAVRLTARAPIVAWAHGVVLHTGLGRVLARHAYRRVRTICARDRGSEETLRSLAPGAPIRLAADPVVCFRPLPDAESRAGRMTIGICLTYWPFYHRSSDLIPYMIGRRLGLYRDRARAAIDRHNSTIARFIDRAIERFDCAVRIFPRYPAAPWQDIQYALDIRAACAHPERVAVEMDDSKPPERYYGRFQPVDLFLASAMHDAIIALSTGKPCLHLAYEQKGRDFYTELDLTEWLAPWELLGTGDDGAVFERFLAMANSASARIEGIRERLETIRRRVSVNLDAVAEALDEPRA